MNSACFQHCTLLKSFHWDGIQYSQITTAQPYESKSFMACVLLHTQTPCAKKNVQAQCNTTCTTQGTRIKYFFSNTACTQALTAVRTKQNTQSGTQPLPLNASNEFVYSHMKSRSLYANCQQTKRYPVSFVRKNTCHVYM